MNDMMKEKVQQMARLLTEHSSFLIALPPQPSTDAIASGLALLSMIEKMGKKATVTSTDFQLQSTHTFLPKSKEVVSSIEGLRKFIIDVDISKANVDELSYTIEGTTLKIYLTPKKGFLTQENVKTEAGPFLFDAIITLDAPELQALGGLFDAHTEFFYQTPVVNIDHMPSNEQFGQVNMVDVTATSNAEIVYDFIKEANEQYLDEDVSTLLLAGMIAKTKSFQSGRVTPRSLTIASQLISRGARREEIVKQLYQSRKLSTLRLWGRVLSQLQADTERHIVWARLDAEDFAATKTVEQDLPDVIDELIMNTPDAKNIFILYHVHNNIVKGIISTAPYINARELFTDLAARGTDHLVNIVSATNKVEEIERTILERLRKTTTEALQKNAA